MRLLSLLHIPLAYSRVSQKYVIDVTDFMLVEIALLILILIMAKAIFEVKLSKLRFALKKAEEAAKFMTATAEDWVTKNGTEANYSNLDFESLPKSLTPNPGKPSTVSSDVSHLDVSLHSYQDYHSINSSLNSDVLFGSCISTVAVDITSQDANMSEAKPATKPTGKSAVKPTIKPTTKPTTKLPTKPEKTVKKSLRQPSQIHKDHLPHESTTKASNTEKSHTGHTVTSKPSKSLPQVLGPEGEGKELQPAKNKNTTETKTALKSLSQEVQFPMITQKTAPIKALRNTIRSAGRDPKSGTRSLKSNS